MAKTKVNRRELLQLANTYKDQDITGWYVSAKLDGVRCWSDGGLTRGLKTTSVPWANTDKKVSPIATGLYTRYGNVINAPDWFLDQLPPYPLDGELFAGRGKFQTTVSIIKRDVPDDRWKQIEYAVYGCPPINNVMQDGEIKNANFHKVIDQKECAQFIAACVETRRPEFMTLDETSTFEHELLAFRYLDSDVAYLHKQVKVSTSEEVDAMLDHELSLGGEGVIIRDPNAVWTPKRVKALLKLKPSLDDVGILTGFTAGRETDKGSKHLGRIGALILDYNGKRLELAGLTDEERELVEGSEYARQHPGKDIVGGVAKHFRIGQAIEFVYRELTQESATGAGQLPREARFKRTRGDM